MKSLLTRILVATTLLLLPTSINLQTALANTRILEFPFALSPDARSEFTAQFPVLSGGKIIVDANWKNPHQQAALVSLKLTLTRPDGSQAAVAEANNSLRLEYRASEPEVDSFNARRAAKWAIKLSRATPTNAQELNGKLRITIPAATRTFVDTQFTLTDSGNAQEIPFNLIAPGRVIVEIEWESDSNASASVPLTFSLIHSSSSRTIARKQGASPLRIEHLATSQELDSGIRWLVRVQNDNQQKIKGRLKIIFTPSL
ncbi:MAG: hypothetical protein AB1757_01585 [Acidobacteriota bacterium]